jgi:hypothetical protein
MSPAFSSTNVLAPLKPARQGAAIGALADFLAQRTQFPER